MIYVSPDLVLSAPPASLATPVFGLHSLVTINNITATASAEGNPAINLANPQTHNFWRGDYLGSPAIAHDLYLTAAIAAVDPVDYVGIAGHNFGSQQITVSVEALDESTSPDSWLEIVPEFVPADDTPLILRFTPAAWSSVRIRLQPSLLDDTLLPRAAVLHVGKLLVAPRGTSADHIPINLARRRQIETGMSESGQFLGRIQIGESRGTNFSIAHMDSAWYRANFDPFVRDAGLLPFFFAWRPTAYPRDVGYCWFLNDPNPPVAFETRDMSIDLQLGGIA